MPSPETRLIRKLFPELFTTQEVADEVGKSKTTIERWRKSKQLMPSESHKLGNKTIWLYTLQDIALGKQLAKTQRPGPKENTDAA